MHNKFENLKEKVISTLKRNLSKELCYHSLEHTLYVLEKAEQLAQMEKCSEEETLIVKSAALLHDIGFIIQNELHEDASSNFARKLLPEFDFGEDQIDQVCHLINSTKMPQNPHDKLSRIMCDADLFYLGTLDYEKFAERLHQENTALGQSQSKAEWWLKQIDFLSQHRYFTKSAQALLDEQKNKTLESLKTKLEIRLSEPRRQNNSQILVDSFLIIFGIIFSTIGLKGFLVPNHFFDGGLTGISMLIHEFYHVHLGLTVLLVNIPFIIISYYTVGKTFALRTFICIIILGISLYYIPEFGLTSDKLLIAIFGGVFLGIGIGFIMRTGAALDGIEVLALFTLKRTSFSITEIIMGINIFIFSIAAFKFGVETALYSILTYFAATRTIDYVVEGIQAHTGVTIVSSKSELIKYQLVNNLSKAITVYKGERGYLPGQYSISNDCDIIYLVISRLEMRKIKNLIFEIDPSAFIFASAIKEASGGILRKLHKH